MNRRIFLITLFTCFFHVFTHTAEIEVSASLQAEIAVYVILQEQNLSQEQPELVMAVIDQDEKDPFFHDIFTEMEKNCQKRLPVKNCTIRKYLWSDLKKNDSFLEELQKEKINALYISGTENESTIPDLALKTSTKGIITVARKRDWVQKGLSFGIFMRDTRPQLCINSSNLRRGSFSLPPEILRFSEFSR